MATLAVQQVRLVQTYNGGAPEYEKIAPSASATWRDGSLLLKTNQAATECGSDPTVISWLAQGADTAVVPGETKAVLLKIKPEDTFEMSMYNGTAANATCADTDLDGQTDLGITLVTVSGVTAWTVDNSNTGADKKRVRVIERLSAAADVYPRVRVKFLASVLTNGA